MLGDKMKSASAPPSRGVRVFPRFHFPQRLRQGKSRTLKVRNSTALAEQPPQAQFLSSKIGLNACHFFFFGVPSSSKASLPCCFHCHEHRLPCSSSQTCHTSSPTMVPRRLCRCGYTHSVQSPLPRAVAKHLLAPTLAVLTSKTPEGRSATFRVQDLFFFDAFLIVFIFDLNCCTISWNTSESLINQIFEPSREVAPFRPLFLIFSKKRFAFIFTFFTCVSFHFLFFLLSFLLAFVIIFCFSVKGSLHSGRSKVTRVAVSRKPKFSSLLR